MFKRILISFLFLLLALNCQAAHTHCWTSINRNSTRYPLQSETYQWVRNIQGNSGTISNKSIWAGDQCVKDLKRFGFRSTVQYLLTYSGDNLAAALCPIIYDIGTSVATNYNFVAGDLSNAGLIGNGTTKYLDLGFTGLQIGATSSYHLACNRDNTYDGVAVDAMLGCFRSGEGTFMIDSSAGILAGWLSSSGVSITGTDAYAPGFALVTRSTSTHITNTFKISGGSLLSVTGALAEASPKCQYIMSAFAMRHASTAGSVMYISKGKYNFMSVGNSVNLTTDEGRAAYRTIINNFLSRMGRTTFQ